MIKQGLQCVNRYLAAFPTLTRSMASSYPLDVKSQETGLFKMPEIPPCPFTLFKKWYSDNQSSNHIASNALCLATASKSGKVSSRNVILRRLDDDGFVIMTDNRSKKSKELAENPYAAMSFLWVKDNDGIIHSRQIRAEGEVKELPYDDWKEIYSQEPLFCKIRAYVCHQGIPVNWDNMKEHHDRLLEEFKQGKNELIKPDHVVAYKIWPQMIEFYESKGPTIADRVMYLKEKENWQSTRIAA